MCRLGLGSGPRPWSSRRESIGLSFRGWKKKVGWEFFVCMRWGSEEINGERSEEKNVRKKLIKEDCMSQ